MKRLAKLGQFEGDTTSVHLVPVLRKGAANEGAKAVSASVEIAVI